MRKIIVEVYGAIVTAVYVEGEEDFDVEILDYDVIKYGDEKEAEEMEAREAAFLAEKDKFKTVY